MTTQDRAPHLQDDPVVVDLIYCEDAHAATGGWNEPEQPSPTPTGVAVFPTDVAIRRYNERANTIVHRSEFRRGGHFAALEAPALVVGDVRSFFRQFC